MYFCVFLCYKGAVSGETNNMQRKITYILALTLLLCSCAPQQNGYSQAPAAPVVIQAPHNADMAAVRKLIRPYAPALSYSDNDDSYSMLMTNNVIRRNPAVEMGLYSMPANYYNNYEDNDASYNYVGIAHRYEEQIPEQGVYIQQQRYAAPVQQMQPATAVAMPAMAAIPAAQSSDVIRNDLDWY